MHKKLIIIAGFITFGTLLGFLSIWYDRHYDLLFFLNLPGDFAYLALDSILSDSAKDPALIDFFNALYRVISSVLAWGIIGTLLTIFLKPKIIAWIMGGYLVIFGGFTLIISLA